MQTKILRICLWMFILFAALSGIYIYGVIVKANGDNVEHLHSSWLVWQGYVPYRDFFQHHNPLLWYLSAPLVAMLINTPDIFPVFNTISIATLSLIACFQYKILRLNNNTKNASLFVAALSISSYSLLWSANYKPDIFMFLMFFIGLYELLYYIKKQKPLALYLSFIAFLVAFGFTQKALMFFVIPGFAVIYWLISGKIQTKTFLGALNVCLFLLLLFISVLFVNGILAVYWRSNFYFNTYIPQIFEAQRIIFPPSEFIDFYIFLPLGVVASFYFIYKGSVIERLFAWMFCFETVLRLFYFSAFLHYVMFWLMVAIMLTVMFFDKFSKLRKYFAGLGLLYLVFILFYNYEATYKKEILSFHMKSGHDFAFEVLTPCDYALNGYYATYNLKAKDPGYYAILLGQIDVLGEKAGIAKRDNLNTLIIEKKPKIISAGIYWDTYWEQRGKKIPAHIVDSYLIDTYYDYTGFGDIHILKPQYQKHNCVYDNNEWKYMD
ncbi:MAG: glycosyltransferase family 39 protein [Alphaproteobacteria bacterium]|nr:glycosyltransferase family 39 protein [Alphaproteobacteria bacterium]